MRHTIYKKESKSLTGVHGSRKKLLARKARIASRFMFKNQDMSEMSLNFSKDRLIEMKKRNQEISKNKAHISNYESLINFKMHMSL